MEAKGRTEERAELEARVDKVAMEVTASLVIALARAAAATATTEAVAGGAVAAEMGQVEGAAVTVVRSTSPASCAQAPVR